MQNLSDEFIKRITMKKIDVAILVIVIIIAVAFLYKVGYFYPEKEEEKEIPPCLKNVTEKKQPPPPPTIILPSRRVLTGEDEGCHFHSLMVSREWWTFTANLDGEMKGWSIIISFNHMAYGDLFGQLKPDVFVLVLSDDKGNVYGGLTNEKRGTLIATAPGVDITFGESWAQGTYPEWHVHAEMHEKHSISVDLDYFSHSLPLWTSSSRIINASKGNLASYILLGCNVTGKISLDGVVYEVTGKGFFEHSWSPFYVRKFLVDGWDRFYISLDNGWQIYISKYYPTPSSISSKLHKIITFGELVITPDGESITEFKTFDLKIKQKEKIFIFTKFPTSFSLSAEKKMNILLQQIDLKINLDITTKGTFQKIWKFPTYVGTKIGMCTVKGKISWRENSEEISLELNGYGIVWTTRALP